MSRSLYTATLAPGSGKALVALGVVELLAGRVDRVGFFRPVIRAEDRRDNDIELIRAPCCSEQPYESAYGVTHEEARQMVADGDQERLLKPIQYDAAVDAGVANAAWVSELPRFGVG